MTRSFRFVLAASAALALAAPTAAQGPPLSTRSDVLVHFGRYEMGAREMAAADFDRDGRSDLVLVGNYLTLFPGESAAPRRLHELAQGYYEGVTIDDLDGDGWADLAAARGDSNVVHVLLNAGTDGLSFRPATRHVAGAAPYGGTGRGLRGIAAADFDGDGNADLAVTSRPNELVFLPGVGDGSFGPPVVRTGFPTPDPTHGLATGDLDGDGRPDLAAAWETGQASLAMFFNRGGFTFEYASHGVNRSGYVHGVVIADLNEDGWPDLAGTGRAGVEVVLSQGGGQFSPSVVTEVPDLDTNTHASKIAAADVDLDGHLDLAVSHGVNDANGPVLTVLRGDGVGAPAVWHQYYGQFTSGNYFYYSTAIALADFTGDGRPDVAVFSTGSSEFGLYYNTSTASPPRSEVADLDPGSDTYETGTPGEPGYFGLLGLRVEQSGELGVQIRPSEVVPVEVCVPFGPGGIELCQSVDVHTGTVTVTTRTGGGVSPVVAEGRPALPVTEAAPPGTVPAIVALQPDGSLSVIGGGLIGGAGGNVVSAGGGNVVSAGGGNVISAGGGNVVSAGGGNVVSAGGLNRRAGPAEALDGDESLTLFVAFLPEVRLDARLLLDGALAEAAPMRTDLLDADLLPSLQPYVGGDLGASVKSLADSTVAVQSFLDGRDDLVDWVVVELQHPEGGSVRRAAFLRADGQIVDFDSSTVAFRGIPPGDYSVAVYHRNHATAVTAAPVTFEAGTASVVDFTALADGARQLEVAPGVWAQRGGDVDGDGAVTAADLDPAFVVANGTAGYVQADLALDGGASASDAQAVLYPALGRARPTGLPAPGTLSGDLVYTTDPATGDVTAFLRLAGPAGATLGTSTLRLAYDASRYAFEEAWAPGLGAAYAAATLATEAAPGALSVNVVLVGTEAEDLDDSTADVIGLRFLRRPGQSGGPALAWGDVEAYDGPGGPAGAFDLGAFVVTDAGFATDAPAPAVPSGLALEAPYPNPTRGAARLAFALPEAGAVRLSVHDALGREVAVLAEGPRAAGVHEAALDAALAPGVYVVRLATGAGVASRPLTVVR